MHKAIMTTNSRTSRQRSHDTVKLHRKIDSRQLKVIPIHKIAITVETRILVLTHTVIISPFDSLKLFHRLKNMFSD